jgi:hypothetical protein
MLPRDRDRPAAGTAAAEAIRRAAESWGVDPAEAFALAERRTGQGVPRVPHVPDVGEPSRNGDGRDSRDSSSRRTRWTAPELLAEEFPEPRWSVPGIIPEGLTMFVGKPKVGKSWLQLGLGVAIASGGIALGSIPVEQGDVLYLALEDPARRLQDRLRKVLRDGPAPERLTVERACPPLASGGSKLITEWIDDHADARLVMIDVLARVRGIPPTGMSAYDADYLALAAAKQIADDHGVSILLAHHDRKLKADDWLDMVSGTNGLAAAADTIAMLSRPRGRADGLLQLTGRDVDEVERALEFDASTACWSLLEGPAVDYTVSDTRALILQALRSGGAMRPRQLATALDQDYELVKKTVRRMADDGQVGTDGNGLYFSQIEQRSLSDEGGPP